jgi:hypothetical protein
MDSGPRGPDHCTSPMASPFPLAALARRDGSAADGIHLLWAPPPGPAHALEGWEVRRREATGRPKIGCRALSGLELEVLHRVLRLQTDVAEFALRQVPGAPDPSGDVQPPRYPISPTASGCRSPIASWRCTRPCRAHRLHIGRPDLLFGGGFEIGGDQREPVTRVVTASSPGTPPPSDLLRRRRLHWHRLSTATRATHGARPSRSRARLQPNLLLKPVYEVVKSPRTQNYPTVSQDLGTTRRQPRRWPSVGSGDSPSGRAVDLHHHSVRAQELEDVLR